MTETTLSYVFNARSLIFIKVDWRVRPLVLAVKDWAKAVGINEARFSTLSSYCLTLMVLHFLQAGVKDQVVPNLHELHPNVFNPESNIFDLPFTCDIEPSFKSKNKSSLGKLMLTHLLNAKLFG